MRSVRLASPVLLLFLFPAVLQAQRPLTPPFRVDLSSGQLKYLPQVAANADGELVVTWLQQGASLDFHDLHARRYSVGGTPVTGDLLVSGQLVVFQQAVALRKNGSFVVAFVTGSGLTIQIHGPDGALARESLISASGQHPALAVRDDGTFLLVWNRDGALLARSFNGGGDPLGPERVLASVDLTVPPAVAARPDRSFVVAWSRVRPIPANPHFNNFTLFAQRLGPAGAPRGAAIVVRPEAPSGALAPDVATDSAGNFLVVWSEPVGIGFQEFLGRRYTAAGTPASGLLTLENPGDDLSHITMDPAGNFVVAWLSYDHLGEVLAQRFTAGGAPFRPLFQVDTPPPTVTSAPDVASAASGNFVVAWAAGDGVYARLYRKR